MVIQVIYLVSLQYMQSLSDHSLFTKINGQHHTILLIYVDELIHSSNNLEEIHKLKSTFDITFKIKDLGNIQFFLGIEMVRSSLGISIC